MTISVSLGPRLHTVASFVPKGAKLGDIGTDHAYLPITLVETQRICKAVAIDVHEGPYQSALAAVRSRHLENIIDVRFGDGLMPLVPGEVDALTFAGMGGRTMLDILSARPEVLVNVDDLILQPQGGESSVRLALLKGGWRLKTECLVEEESRIYVVMAFSRKEGWDLTELKKKEQIWAQRLSPLWEGGIILAEEKRFSSIIHKLVWHFGPLVLEGRTDLVKNLLGDYTGLLLKRMEQMKKSKNAEVMVKVRELSAELALVEGLGTWQ